MTPISLALVDDHTVVRRGLRTLFESYPDFVIVGEASSGEEALARLPEQIPDVVVMDLLLPGGMDGIESTRRLRQLSPHTQVVVLTSYTDEARAMAALRAGAIGYIRKDADPELLVLAVRAAAGGQSMLDPAVAGAVFQELAHAHHGEPLTERETGVLRELARGQTNREIAEALSVSEETVKKHVGNILAKLQLAHRTKAALYALKQGLISLDEIEL